MRRDPPIDETDAVVAAVRKGDEETFAALADRYRPQLRVHCYRMLGSVDEAEDLVQETFLRAWRARADFEGRSLFRTWLYRIATNACLNAIERGPRRVMPQDVAPAVTVHTDASEARAEPPWAPEIPWIQPYPDHLLEPAASGDTEPDTIVLSRETIELAFIAVLQHLPRRQRATLILREVLGWSAQETADLLDTSVQSVNGALQRARATLRARQPDRGRPAPGGPSPARPSPASTAPRTATERDLLRRYMDAWEQKDASALTALLREDARWSMPPAALWFDGRAAIERLFELFPIARLGDVRLVPTTANRQPAAAAYIRPPGQETYRLAGLTALRIEGDQIAELVTFSPALISAFRLPPTL